MPGMVGEGRRAADDVVCPPSSAPTATVGTTGGQHRLMMVFNSSCSSWHRFGQVGFPLDERRPFGAG